MVGVDVSEVCAGRDEEKNNYRERVCYMTLMHDYRVLGICNTLCNYRQHVRF